MDKISSLDYCRRVVREKDYGLYVLHFFMPRENRAYALSVMALHCELSAIPNKVQDPSMRIIRLKWWYDGVMNLLDGRATHDSPVLEVLRRNISARPPSIENIFNNYFNKIGETINNSVNQDTYSDSLNDILFATIDGHAQRVRLTRLMNDCREYNAQHPLFPLTLWFKNILYRLRPL